MKIAMVSEWWDPVYGWGQIHVKYLCEWLVKNHWCFVDLFVRKLKDNDWKSYKDNESFFSWNRNIIRTWWLSDFFSLPYRIIWLFQITWTLYRATKKKKYDLIHWHALLPWLPIKIVSLLTWVPCVYTVHGMPLSDRGLQSIFAKIERYLVCNIRYSLEISVSHNIFRYANYNKKILIIPNWVDIKKINSIHINKDKEHLVFLTVWRMDKNKNHIIILDALNDLKQELHKNIKFIRIGDGEEKEFLEKTIKQRWLHQFVSLLGKLSYEETLKEFKKATVFVLPSLWEWQPLTVLEAFASWLPVIATDVGDNKYFVSSSSGMLIQPWNIGMLKDALMCYVNKSKENIWEQSNYVKKYCLDFDWDYIVKKTYYSYQNDLWIVKS